MAFTAIYLVSYQDSVLADEAEREKKGKMARRAYLELQRAAECKLMYGAMAVKAAQQD